MAHASAYYLFGEYQLAVDWQIKASALLRENRDYSAALVQDSLRVRSLLWLEKPAEARQLMANTVKEADASSGDKTVAKTLQFVRVEECRMLMMLEDFAEAEVVCSRHLAQIRRDKAEETEDGYFANLELGRALAMQAKGAQAIAQYHKTLDLIYKIEGENSNSIRVAEARMAVGIGTFKMGNPEAGKPHLQAACKIYEAHLGITSCAHVRCALVLVDLHQAQKNPAAARAELTRVSPALADKRLPEEVRDALLKRQSALGLSESGSYAAGSH
jgi:tetratricopeptide (TPR) repeat protein